jgi:hypothetical protein
MGKITQNSNLIYCTFIIFAFILQANTNPVNPPSQKLTNPFNDALASASDYISNQFNKLFLLSTITKLLGIKSTVTAKNIFQITPRNLIKRDSRFQNFAHKLSHMIEYNKIAAKYINNKTHPTKYIENNNLMETLRYVYQSFQALLQHNSSDTLYIQTEIQNISKRETSQYSLFSNNLNFITKLLPANILMAPLKLSRNKRQLNNTNSKLNTSHVSSHLNQQLANLDKLLQHLETKFKKVTNQIAQIKTHNFQWIVKQGEDGLTPSRLAYENALIIMAFTSLLLVATLVTIFKQKPKTAITKTRTLFLHT